MSGLWNVYFLRPVGQEGPIKIGCSKWPANRLVSLAQWSPIPLEIIASVPGAIADEQFLHSCFSATHSHREWFHASPDLLAAIEKIASANSVEAVRGELSPVGSIRSKGKGARPVPAYRVGYRSYSSRIVWAERKLRRLGEDTAWQAPADVGRIMQRWDGVPYRHVAGARPTEAEFARLDEYLADPAVHSVIPLWRRKEAA